MPLDPRSPFLLDTKELSRRPGSMLEVSRTVPAPQDFGTDVIGVPHGDPIDLDLRLESVVEGVLVSGVARTTAVGACVRCLDPVRLEVDADVQELFAYAERAAHLREVSDQVVDDEEDEVYELDGGLADLEPVLRDSVVPTLPFQPVCRADCLGLCSVCGFHLNNDPSHHHDVLDPRWAALADLTGSPEHTQDHNEKRN